jgi:hypothetical protein
MNMTNRMKRLLRPVLVSWACSLVFVTPSHSQTEDHFATESVDGTVPITVVLAQGHGPPLIFRRATEPKNVIVVNRSTNAAQHRRRSSRSSWRRRVTRAGESDPTMPHFG